MDPVRLFDRPIGEGYMCYVVAEIGINHNGDIDLARRMICAAKRCGCDAVKFQKRTIDAVYTKEELNKPLNSPFGRTVGDAKRGRELDLDGYRAIDEMCKFLDLPWFASVWDPESANFIAQFDVPCFKIASASLTDYRLLWHMNNLKRPVILSTGMSNQQQVDMAVNGMPLCPLILLHAVSEYPMLDSDHANLRVMDTLRKRYSCPVGYSGHELGYDTTLMAVARGANIVERHFTTDRDLWGTDQSMSLDPCEMSNMVMEIRRTEAMLGSGVKQINEYELGSIRRLRQGPRHEAI